jgi:hypothetical protein
MDKDLSGKVFLVTGAFGGPPGQCVIWSLTLCVCVCVCARICHRVIGANSGLGRSTATTLAKKGGKVYMLCRNQERGEEVRLRCRTHSESLRVYAAPHIVSIMVQARREIIKETGNEDIHLEIVDTSLQSSIRTFVKRFVIASRTPS